MNFPPFSKYERPASYGDNPVCARIAVDGAWPDRSECAAPSLVRGACSLSQERCQAPLGPACHGCARLLRHAEARLRHGTAADVAAVKLSKYCSTRDALLAWPAP